MAADRASRPAADVSVVGGVEPPRQASVIGRVVGLVMVLALTLAAWAAEQPPPPMPASGSETLFSAERAWEHLEELARVPSPLGSEENARVRSYLVDQLETIGLEVDVEQGVGSWTFGSSVEVGRVSNVVARLPGRDSTGRVIIAAHYDTVVHSPGASDDKASVVAVLETARALAGDEPPLNDIVFLLTDGEEPGLLGAALYAGKESEGGFVLNWEGYGNTGPSVMYQTSDGNAGLIEEFARSAPAPVGDSAMAALYQLGSNNTDFTVLREAGFVGLEFSWLDGVAHYDSPTDTIDNFNPSSLQHHGETMLNLTRSLGGRDLSDLDTTRDVTYFSLFGVVISYSESLAWPLAAAGIATLIALAVAARRARLITIPRLLAAILAAVAPLVAAPLAAHGLWRVLVAVRPGYQALTLGDIGDPYRPGLYRWALVALTVTILLGWYLLFRRRIGSLALTIGALIWVGGLGVVGAGFAPGLSHLGSISILFASTGILVAVLAGDRRPMLRLVALTAGVTPGVLLVGAVARATLGVVGMAGGLGAAVFITFAGLIAMPLLAALLGEETTGQAWGREASTTRGAGWALAVTLALAVSFAGVGLAVDRFDEEHPEQAHLAYLFDADAGSAVWVSEDVISHPWAAGYASGEANEDLFSTPLPYRSRVRWTGPAPVQDLVPPEITVLDQANEGDGSVLRLQLSSPRDAQVVVLQVDDRVHGATVIVSGETTSIPSPEYPSNPDQTDWPFELRFYDPPLDGLEVILRIESRERPRIAVSDITVGLSGIDGFTPRPSGVVPSNDGVRISSDSVVVRRTYQP